jgi:hypothetical protein
VRLGGEQPGDGPRVLVNAEPGHVLVGDVGEQPSVRGSRGLLQRRLDLIERGLVTDLDHAERLVNSEPAAACVFDRLVMPHNSKQAIGVSGLWCEHDAPPGLVDPDRPDPIVLAVVDLL